MWKSTHHSLDVSRVARRRIEAAREWAAWMRVSSSPASVPPELLGEAQLPASRPISRCGPQGIGAPPVAAWESGQAAPLAVSTAESPYRTMLAMWKASSRSAAVDLRPHAAPACLPVHDGLRTAALPTFSTERAAVAPGLVRGRVRPVAPDLRSGLLLLVTLLSPAGLAQQVDRDATTLERRRESYATVAVNLAAKLDDGSAKSEERFDPAIIEARERWRAITLGTVESPDRRLEVVGKEGARAQQRLLQYAEQSSDSSAAFTMIGSLATGDMTGLTLAVLRSLKEGETRDAQLAELVRSRRAASLLLAELAPSVAGPITDHSPLSIDFDESWFDPSTPDQLKLTNISGAALARCTVQVDLRGRDGMWVRNIHFVPSWPAGADLLARYVTISPTEPQAVLGLSAILVEELAITFWCDQLRSERLSYRYLGEQRDADLTRQLNDHLAVTVDYVASPFTEPGPSLGVTISGVSQLPACTVALSCNGGNATAPFQFGRDAWTSDDRYSYPTRGVLRDCPNSVDVTIKLDGMEVTWTHRVPITRRR